MENKDKGFWEKLKEWDVLFLSETWLQKKGWERVRRWMPRGYIWEMQEAGKRNKKGRAMGGMIMGVREGIRREMENSERKEEGLLAGKVSLGGEWWRLVGVYVNGDLDRKLSRMREWMEDGEEGVRVLIGGDFNARTGRKGGRMREEGEGRDEEETRRSRDEKINGEGKKLCGYIGELGWSILNGNVEGDEEGEWTYTGGKGGTVIDYVIGNEDTRERVKKMKVEDWVDSDHQPITVWVEGGGDKEVRAKKRENRGRRGVWTEEGKKKFEEYFGEKEGEREGVEDGWRKLRKRVEETLERVEKEEKEEKGREKGGWWDGECRGMKRRVKEELKRWKREGGEGEKYKEWKKKYRELCKEKKREERERWEREIEGIRSEREVWKVVNKERKRRKRVKEGIELEEWEGHFRAVLGGVEWKVRREVEERGGEEEEEISREEIERVVKKLKERKAAGGDGIVNEVWKYGGKEIREWLWEICNRVWKGEGWPEEWREGVVVPVVKKGEGERVQDYRGITLTQTAYKVYAAVLGERLREEVEGKGILPPSQTGFRRGMGTMDQIYVLNYLINKRVAKRGGKLVVLFIDMKAAFDSVDRDILMQVMRRRGVRESLVVRCEELLEETVCRVRVEGREGERFWTGKGVRQGCPLSPCLFTLLMADLDDELEKGGWGGVKVKGKKVYSLAYADDVAVVAEEEAGMKGMIKTLERYVEQKGLEVNVEKTKVMRCRRGGGRQKRIIWKWKGREIEEVKRFKYLGYVLMQNGGQKEHIEERVKKGALVMREVWGIGKRRFGKDWARRMWLFDRLVWSVVSYGVEIWGWKEREGIERIQDRYMRWILGVGRYTPGYMVREEMQREKLRGRAGVRAWGYERRLGEGGGGELARLCWEEMRDGAKEGKVTGKWEEERKDFYEEKRWSVMEIERMRERGELRGEEIIERERRWQEQERWEKIRTSGFNRWYGRIKGKGVPEYLKRDWKEERWQRVAKFRLGDGMRGGRYWEEEEGRRCRVCGMGEETWEHVWEECTNWGEEKGWQEMVEVVLGEGGEGEMWMKRLEEMREGGGGCESDGGVNGSVDDRERKRKENAAEAEVQE